MRGRETRLLIDCASVCVSGEKEAREIVSRKREADVVLQLLQQQQQSRQEKAGEEATDDEGTKAQKEVPSMKLRERQEERERERIGW